MRSHRYFAAVSLLIALLAAGARGGRGDAPIRHRIMLSEYGKGPNRLIEVSPEGKLVWEHRFPSIATIFQVLPNGHVVYGYGGNPTGVQEVDREHHVVWDYV